MADDARVPLNDGELAAAFRSSRRAAGEHLTEVEWERLTCDEMSADERDTALVHIMNCAECSTIHRSLMQLGEGASEIDPPSQRFGETGSRPSSGNAYRRWMIPGGLATAAAIFLALLIDRPARVEPNEVVRSGGVKSSVTLITPRPQAQLGSNRTLAWQPVQGADTYEVRVTTTDGSPIFTSKLDETSTQVPKDLELSGEYFWQVVALKGGTSIAASPLAQFNVGYLMR